MFCLTCKSSGIKAHQWLGITDEVAVFDIESTVALRLLLWDTEVKKHDRKMLAYEVCKMAFGTKEDDDVLDADTLHPLVRDDPYADANTIIS